MEIVIRKLTPDLAEDYARFFDETAHNEGADKCYCVTWRTDDTYACDENGDWNHWFPTPEERRERAVQFIKAGSLRGYLAYCDDQERIVGWCNANANCAGCLDYLRSFWPMEAPRADIKIMSIFCFVVAPDMQMKGVATKLTERVCADAANESFEFVEAYVDVHDTAMCFRGPLGLYEKCGFTRCGERDGKIVLRKILK